MRKLTVKREKSFVGCLASMKLYIEDSKTGDEKLPTYTKNGDSVEKTYVSCRKLGEIKNGEESTFEIGEEAARLFVIADKLSKEYCNECYQIPEGSEDLFLSGKNKFNPAAGNAFRFNGNDSENAKNGRKSGIKRGIIITVASLIIGFGVGYVISTAVFAIINSQEKTFETGEMSITLNEGFEEQKSLGFNAAFVSRDVEIMGFKTKFSRFGSSKLTAEEYAKNIIENDELDYSEIISENGLIYYVFKGFASDNHEYRYYVYTYKTDDAYWQLYFAVKESKADRYADDIAEWAGSVSFK